MRVVHVSTRDSRGGAALAAHRLHSELRRSGCDSVMFVDRRGQDDSSVLDFQPPRDASSKWRRFIRRQQIEWSFRRYKNRRPGGYGSFTDDRVMYGDQAIDQLPTADITNLHWIRAFIDVGAFFGMIEGPVVWTLHDLNPFTGGCHYDDGCGKFAASCGACPQLGSDAEADLSRAIWARKNAAFGDVARDDLHLVAPSEWMRREAQGSSLLGRFPVSVIPNGVDVDTFAPRKREAVREALDIPSEAVVLLFVAGSLDNRRKGFRILMDVMREMGPADPVYLVSVGNDSPILGSSVRHKHLGRIEDSRLLSLVYSAADAFIIPSIQDNLPNTVLEAMACGTPVIGSDAGGIPDMVRPGETGMLFRVGDGRGLREAILRLVRDRWKREAMAERCREVVLQEYTTELQAQRYASLYQDILKRPSVVQTGKAETDPDSIHTSLRLH